MQILEKQSLYMKNVIVYRTHYEKERSPEILDYFIKSLKDIGIEVYDKVLIREISGEAQNIELLFPVNMISDIRIDYKCMDKFALYNVVSVRHEGNYLDVLKTENRLTEYIYEHSYKIKTDTYYRIVRFDSRDKGSSIIDIYIGIE